MRINFDIDKATAGCEKDSYRFPANFPIIRWLSAVIEPADLIRAKDAHVGITDAWRIGTGHINYPHENTTSVYVDFDAKVDEKIILEFVLRFG